MAYSIGEMKHNHWAILAAVIFQQAFSFFWYSPIFLYPAWEAALKKSGIIAGHPGWGPFVVALIGSAMFCYLMNWFYQVLVIDDWFRGLVVGLLIGSGFLLPTMSTHYFFMGFGPDLVWIDGLKTVFSTGITGVILAVWRADKTAEQTPSARFR